MIDKLSQMVVTGIVNGRGITDLGLGPLCY
jgi:hypothetical protein